MLTRSLFSKNLVAKRLLWAFILATLIPVCILGGLSYYQVNDELEKSAFSELRKSSKEYGLRFINRLSMAEKALRFFDAQMVETNHISQEFTLPNKNRVKPFLSHIVFSSSDRTQVLWGEPSKIPKLDAADQKQLMLGNVVIKVVNNSKDDFSLWVVVPRADEQDGALMGRIEENQLWEKDSLGLNELMVFGGEGSLWYSTLGDIPLPAEIEQVILDQTSGIFNLSLFNGARFLAAFWQTPLHNMFSSSDIVIVQLQASEVALAKSEYFKFYYPPLILLVVLVVLYFVTKLITYYLSPLAALQEATEKLVEGDFSHQVVVKSHDEFKSLADSFNKMTMHLRNQFEIQATMAEIDRLILSVRDADEVIENAIERLPKILGVEMMAIATVHQNARSIEKISFRFKSGASEVIKEPTALSEADLKKLKALDGHYAVLASKDLSSHFFIRQLVNSEHYYCLVVPVFVDEAVTAIIVFVYNDENQITDEVKQIARNFGDRIAIALSNASWEDKLYNQAHYDSLTGLPNRRVLQQELHHAIARARRDETFLALLFIDLDRFKSINDSLGHAMGDGLLINVANRLVLNSRDTDLVVRISGDEFVILLADIGDKSSSVIDLTGVCEKLLSAISKPFLIDGHTLHLTASIGIAVFPEDAETPEGMLKHADAAMYHAKESGRGKFHFYQPEMTLIAIEQMKLEHAMRQAIDNNEFVLHFQPKFDVSHRVVGAEALIRWIHPELGIISPAEFIPIAEKNLFIIDIGRWVFEECCLFINYLTENDIPDMTISVNLSAVEFERPELRQYLTEILDRTQTEPERLELELTETVAISNKETCIKRMNELRDLGLSLAMDDFGTGFSSLSYLQEMPLSTLKIDREFVDKIKQGQSSQAIIKAIIALAAGLDMKVIAEGVETAEQFDFLTENNCDVFQGFLFSKPLSKEDFVALLKQQ